jgi:hypothetical protein
MLLRSQWLGSLARNSFVRGNTPWQAYIPTRISFLGEGSGDFYDCSWFIWDRRPEPSQVFKPCRFVVLPYADRDYRERWRDAA